MMKRNVSEVRRAVARRKAEKLRAIQSKQFIRPIKPSHPKQKPGHKQKEQPTPVFVKQWIASAFVFLAVLFFNQFTHPSNEFSQWVNNQLRDDFPFATVHVWYQDQFGSPLGFFIEDEAVPVVGQQAVPVNGIINTGYDLKGHGVMIEAHDQPEVYAIDQGTVVFAGNDSRTNKTVIIQHPDRTKSTYGFLDKIDVRPYQFVQASQQIGMTSGDSPVYFSLQKNNEYIDPVEVISVNELE